MKEKNRKVTKRERGRKRDRETEETEKGKLSPAGLTGREATWSEMSIHHWELSPMQQVAMIKMMTCCCCCCALPLVCMLIGCKIAH